MPTPTNTHIGLECEFHFKDPVIAPTSQNPGAKFSQNWYREHVLYDYLECQCEYVYRAYMDSTYESCAEVCTHPHQNLYALFYDMYRIWVELTRLNCVYPIPGNAYTGLHVNSSSAELHRDTLDEPVTQWFWEVPLTKLEIMANRSPYARTVYFHDCPQSCSSDNTLRMETKLGLSVPNPYAILKYIAIHVWAHSKMFNYTTVSFNKLFAMREQPFELLAFLAEHTDMLVDADAILALCDDWSGRVLTRRTSGIDGFLPNDQIVQNLREVRLQ